MNFSEWRLLDTGIQKAPYNMALEKVLLASCAEGTVPNTLHLLEFFPCVLLGYNQSVGGEVDTDYCRANGIEINRRISGGGCIYMDSGVLGWEIIAKKNTTSIPGSLDEMYRALCGGVVLALSGFGIGASYRPVNDIEVNGRKISGTGGTELDDSFIFHGTVLVDFHTETMIKALKLPLKKLEDKQVSGFMQRTVSMRELLGYVPPMPDVKAALAKAFSKTLGAVFAGGGLSAGETEMMKTELPFFGSQEWIDGKQSGGSSMNTFEHKAPGGLIRVSLVLDNDKNYIRSAFITGDFFSSPGSIMELEHILKNTRADSRVITKKVNEFFSSRSIIIPGVSAGDFSHAIFMAARSTGQGSGSGKD